MPYCCQCGKAVGNQDSYCGICGARQPAAAAPPIDYMHSIRPRTASLLCYVPMLGWIVSIVVLASVRFRNDGLVRFHAFQSLYLFVTYLLVDWVLGPMMTFEFGPFRHVFPPLMKAIIYGAWIFMIVKTAQDQVYKLPILGDLAEKSVSEQR